MVLGITASLIGIYSPRTVQLVVTGLTVGETYSVAGNWSGGSWPVRAGIGVAVDTQVVLPDVAAPINTPITYTVQHDVEQAVSAPITVAYGHESVLQSLAGDVSVTLDLRDNRAPRQLTQRQSTFMVPGRRYPVGRYDIAGGESGELWANTDGPDTATMRELLALGAPLLMRSNGQVADFEATAFLLFTDVSSSLLVGTKRRWQLGYQMLDDPEPDTLAGLPTWDDFDASYTGLTWDDDFDSEWAGSTWDAFDTHDWATRAAT